MSPTKSALKHYFESFGIFTQEEISSTLELFSARTLKKSELFVSQGQACTEIGFITSGICRSYYLSEKGEEITYCFRFPQEFIVAYSSFITGQGSLEDIQALSPTELLVISKADVDRLAATSPGWMQFLKITAEYQFIELEKRIFQLQRVNARTRYEELITNQPEYVQQIPLHYLASYLGITQRHLSRIRKEIVF